MSEMKRSALEALILAAALVAAVPAAQAAPSAKAAQGRREAIDLLAQGQAREAAGDRAGAIALYQQSAQLAPSPAAFFHLGRAYATAGDKQTGRQYLMKALELNPGYELAKSELAALGTGSRKKQGGGGSSAPGGGTGNGKEVVPVSGENPAVAELVERAARSPINVDAMQREYVTLNSLRRPEVAAAAQEVPVFPTSASPRIVPFVPPAPARPGAGNPVGVIPPPAVPTPPGTAQHALHPPVPSFIDNESVPKIMSYNEPPPGAAVVPGPGGANQVAAPRGVRATPEPGPDPGTRVPVVNEREVPSLHPGATGLEGVGLVPLEPPFVPSAPGAVEEPILNPPADGGAAPQLAAAAGGKPTVADINAAAFGPAADAQKPSIGYDSPRKVSLGTYAFHRERGDAYRESGRFSDAATEYKTALRLCPADTEVRTLLAEMLSRAGEAAEAQEQFARAEALAPEDPQVYYKQGNAFRDEGQLDKAIGAYLKALNLDPANKFILNNLGVVYMEKGEYAKAAARFKKVVDLDPNYANAILNLGILYDDHLGDDTLALTYYERYLAFPDVPRKGEVERWATAIRNQTGAAPQ